MAQMVKKLLGMQETWVRFLGQERPPGEGNSNPLEYSCLENPMDGGSWQNIPHRVAKSCTRLSGFHYSLFTKEGGTALEVLAYCVPLLPGKEIKPSFLLLHSSVPLFFLHWCTESQDFGSRTNKNCK